MDANHILFLADLLRSIQDHPLPLPQPKLSPKQSTKPSTKSKVTPKLLKASMTADDFIFLFETLSCTDARPLLLDRNHVSPGHEWEPLPQREGSVVDETLALELLARTRSLDTVGTGGDESKTSARSSLER
jgi:hypothetical protein